MSNILSKLDINEIFFEDLDTDAYFFKPLIGYGWENIRFLSHKLGSIPILTIENWAKPSSKMINNENYAEVSRVLGQSETDKQLAFLGKALCEALPQLKNDPNFTSAADNWNRRQNTWPSELHKWVMDRRPPIHNHASISALNNAHAVYVHQVNDQRRAIKLTSTKWWMIRQPESETDNRSWLIQDMPIGSTLMMRDLQETSYWLKAWQGQQHHNKMQS